MLKQDRVVTQQQITSHEDTCLNKLRPTNLLDYNGQTKIKQQLKISIVAAKKRNESLDHVLLHGPPGLGKTTLAQIIAMEMGGVIKQTSGPVLDKKGDLVALLTNLQTNDVLFIDEIHRLKPTLEETLYPAMEDKKIDIMLGEGPAAKAINIKLADFTLVAATTKIGMLTAPLRDRFGLALRLEYYDIVQLTSIIIRSSKINNITIDESSARIIASRSRGTPRIANRLLYRVRDYAQYLGKTSIDSSIVDTALGKLEIDKYGLDNFDRNLLKLLIDQQDIKPVGITTIAAALGEDVVTIEDVVEPYLLQIGLIQKTARGRIATPKAVQHITTLNIV